MILTSGQPEVKQVVKVADRCRMCGGGADEGCLVRDIHWTCIPTFIRRSGNGSVQAFVSFGETPAEVA